ncbi:MAG: carbohydrate binding family 9 domain-containing protein [Flavobacteriaceae bacterium]|nr:carbohydrate binding family 9 domain-containing protein [Flavobacteriaceae bacterium]
MKTFVLTAITLFCICGVAAQEQEESPENDGSLETIEKKTLQIVRTETAPKIDGILDDPIWDNADEATNFTQFRPDMGVKETEANKTIVKLTYDDQAIYVGAYLYDDPEKIDKQLSSRDNFGQSDFFGFVVNPNNDAQNDTEFFVFASGTQADAIANPTVGEDFGWNAVWSSAVKINDDGWVVEMKIPYRCLRFDNKNLETWGLQFHRRFRRDDSQYTWNPIDISKGNIGLYHGQLKGLKELDPPVRLAFYPFVSTVQTSFDGDLEDNYNAGLDVKYGITENFTLDATLIPDFSQARFDNVSLNLGPFEQTFSEQRQFFTEGVDLFNMGNLFFSRRVGSAPTGDVTLGENEEVLDFPSTVKVLNAVKVSGRSKKGLGLGVFNSITESTNATIRDIETGAIREQEVEPFTNYNIMVADQQFNGNSSIGLINTNVLRSGSFRDANVTGIVASISNKRNTYNIRGDVKMSNVREAGETTTGYSSFLFVRKTHGNLRYSFDHRYADTEYDINDIGLQFRNNFNNFGVDASYRIFEPTEKWNRYAVGTYVNYTRLASPSTFTGFGFGFWANGTTKKLHRGGFNINLRPGKQYDYFEPRKEGSFFITENGTNVNGWYLSNTNKRFSVNAWTGIDTLLEEGRDYANWWAGFSPRFRMNDKFQLSYTISWDDYTGDRGYVTQVDDDVIMGDRKRLEVEQTFSTSFNFNPNNTLSLTLRNYWGTVEYDRVLFSLQEDGTVTNETGYTTSNIPDNPDINFINWNFDLSYSWQFAPGSFLTALYRNQLSNFDNAARDTYLESIDTLFQQPITHTVSVKLQYFLDFNQIPSLLRKKKDRGPDSFSNPSVGGIFP